MIEVDISDEEQNDSAGKLIEEEIEGKNDVEDEKERIHLGKRKCKDPECPVIKRKITGKKQSFEHLWRRLLDDFPDLDFYCCFCGKQTKNPHTHVDRMHGAQRHFRTHFGSEFHLRPTKTIPNVITLKREYLKRFSSCFPEIRNEFSAMGEFSAEKMFKEYPETETEVLPPEIFPKFSRKRKKSEEKTSKDSEESPEEFPVESPEEFPEESPEDAKNPQIPKDLMQKNLFSMKHENFSLPSTSEKKFDSKSQQKQENQKKIFDANLKKKSQLKKICSESNEEEPLFYLICLNCPKSQPMRPEFAKIHMMAVHNGKATKFRTKFFD